MKTRSWISSVCFSRCTVCIVYVVSDVIQYDMNWLAHISCENTAQCAVLIWRWFPYSPKFYTCILNYSVHCVSGLRDMSVNGSFLRYSCSAAGVCVEVDDHVMWCVCFSFSVKLWERLGADERFVQHIAAAASISVFTAVLMYLHHMRSQWNTECDIGMNVWVIVKCEWHVGFD